ncbi:uncharacterized protein METZ01_LOCUS318519 [marine metagenome]|uniref:Uncharacterized protein n=1 Tax=marine metagenome TaxID=408172 RepID=A0A382NZ82_9ZZZZ
MMAYLELYSSGHSVLAIGLLFARNDGHGSVAFTLDQYAHLMKGGQEVSAHVMDGYLVA